MRSAAAFLIIVGSFLVGTTSAASAQQPPTCELSAQDLTYLPGYRSRRVLIDPQGLSGTYRIYVDQVLVDEQEDFDAAHDQSNFGGAPLNMFASFEDLGVHTVSLAVTTADGTIYTAQCGAAQMPASFDPAAFQCSTRIVDGFPRIDALHNGRPLRSDADILRDGEPVVLGRYAAAQTLAPPSDFDLVDYSAEGTHRYALRIIGLQPQLVVPCGRTTTHPTFSQIADAGEHVYGSSLGPFFYMYTTLVCPGCEFDEIRLDAGPRSVEVKEFQPSLAQQLETAGVVLPSEHPLPMLPTELFERLRHDKAAGRDVRLQLASWGGIAEWSIDGYGARISCGGYSNVPPELMHTWPFPRSLVGCPSANDSSVGEHSLRVATDLAFMGQLGQGFGILRLYQAYFGRFPDLDGAAYWINLNRNGLSPVTIAEYFLASNESQLNWGAETDDEFVVRTYSNVFGRTPDVAGEQYWITQLRSGLTRGDLIWLFANSDESKRVHTFYPPYLSANNPA